ncbi:leucine zipper protein 4-like [Procambarus clarkii]|uniref:leucine zipper protein 4-like n=1 Tax=Procambarus clarkii TaxID=6728 RepID=UPI0037440A87
MRCLRHILGITWQDKVTNNNVLGRARITSMYTMLKQRRMRWLGHVVRMGDGRIPMQGSPVRRADTGKASSWQAPATGQRRMQEEPESHGRRFCHVGNTDRRPFSLGQSVQKGLFKFEESLAKKSESQLIFAQSQLVTAQSQLVTAQSQLVTAQSQLVTAQSQLVTTQSQLVTGQSQLVTGQSLLVTAQSLLVTAQSQLITGQSQLVTAQSQLVTAQSQLVTAQSQLVTAESQLITSTDLT